MENVFYGGSRAHFDNIEGFTPHDTDYVHFVDEQSEVLTYSKADGDCHYTWRKMQPEEYVTYLINEMPKKKKQYGDVVAMFMSKPICDYIGFTIEHLKQVYQLTEHLTFKHLYLAIIYDYCIMNGSFELTDEQRMNAYNEYLRERNIIKQLKNS